MFNCPGRTRYVPSSAAAPSKANELSRLEMRKPQVPKAAPRSSTTGVDELRRLSIRKPQVPKPVPRSPPSVVDAPVARFVPRRPSASAPRKDFSQSPKSVISARSPRSPYQPSSDRSGGSMRSHARKFIRPTPPTSEATPPTSEQTPPGAIERLPPSARGPRPQNAAYPGRRLQSAARPTGSRAGPNSRVTTGTRVAPSSRVASRKEPLPTRNLKSAFKESSTRSAAKESSTLSKESSIRSALKEASASSTSKQSSISKESSGTRQRTILRKPPVSTMRPQSRGTARAPRTGVVPVKPATPVGRARVMPKEESSGPLTTSNRNPWGAAPKKVPVPSTGASSTAARSKPVIAKRAPAHPTKAVTKKPTTASASAKMSSKPTADGYATRSLKLRLPTENEMAVHKAKTTTVARSFDPARPRANYFGRYPIDLSPEDVCEENRNLPVFNINPIVEEKFGTQFSGT